MARTVHSIPTWSSTADVAPVTIVAEDFEATVDFTDAVDAARADLSVRNRDPPGRGGPLRRVWHRDASALAGWTVERHQ
jgi:hypothetical protein